MLGSLLYLFLSIFLFFFFLPSTGFIVFNFVLFFYRIYCLYFVLLFYFSFLFILEVIVPFLLC